MTREEERKNEAKNKYPYIKGLPQTLAQQEIFIEGAKWADENPKRYNQDELCDIQLEMMKQSDWISVEDRLPRKNKRVLVCRQLADNTLFTDIATYTGKEKIKDISHYWWYTDDGFDIDGITHWQEIILPKKEKE